MSGSINNLFSIARSGLLASQRAVEVAGNNISNANTPGYSRQRLDLVNGDPVQLPNFTAGTGVRIMGIDRARDALLDWSVRDATSSGAGFQQSLFVLEGVEAALAEPGNGGLGGALDRFWGAWSDLSADPANANARMAVRATGEGVVSAFRRIDDAIADARTSAAERLQLSVGELNELGSQVADLNRELLAAEAGGRSAPGLRDRLDQVLDQMSELTGIEVVQRADGTSAVHLNGRVIVDGGVTRPLTVTSTGGTFAVETAAGPLTPSRDGALGSLLELINTELPAIEADLDQLAATVVDQVNTLHATGTNPNGNTGVDFFSAGGTTAGTLSISAAVAADAQEIAAGTPDGTGQYQAGANDVALALADLRTATQASLGGVSITTGYGDFVGDVGLRVSRARSGQEAQETLLLQAEIRRSEVSGVNIDEEMIDLIRFQQAYTAAARMVTTADEMLQTVVNMV